MILDGNEAWKNKNIKSKQGKTAFYMVKVCDFKKSNNLIFIKEWLQDFPPPIKYFIRLSNVKESGVLIWYISFPNQVFFKIKPSVLAMFTGGQTWFLTG